MTEINVRFFKIEVSVGPDNIVAQIVIPIVFTPADNDLKVEAIEVTPRPDRAPCGIPLAECAMCAGATKITDVMCYVQQTAAETT